MDASLLQMQAKLAGAEMQKAQAQQANVQLKAQVDMITGQLEEAKAIDDSAEESAKLQLEYDKLKSAEALKITEIESKERIEVTKAHQQNKQAVNSGST